MVASAGPAMAVASALAAPARPANSLAGLGDSPWSGLRNAQPYAGFWLLAPIAGLSHHWSLFAIIGAAHGAARAVGIMRNMRLSVDGARVGDWSGWPAIRTFDGLAMLLAVGALGIRAFRLV